MLVTKCSTALCCVVLCCVIGVRCVGGADDVNPSRIAGVRYLAWVQDFVAAPQARAWVDFADEAGIADVFATYRSVLQYLPFYGCVRVGCVLTCVGEEAEEVWMVYTACSGLGV